MNNFIPYVLVVLTTITFTIFTISDENTIIDLEHKLHQQNNSIDSLKHEIDTLIWESEIWDHNISYNETHLLSAIIQVESSNNDSAYHIGEDAVGCLQIRQCMVDDVNRILRRQKSIKRYSYHDRWLRYKSIEMFDIYCKHYNLITSEEIARCWNGGPRGMTNEVTVGYWEKVENQLDI
jgi:hypothetical protein|tara:strand:- start:417 stop:953 length:537 start_codon:yes stop_codon:yes gene_type:complete